MKKISRRPNREEIKEKKRAEKKARKALHKENKDNGMTASSHATISNHKCDCKNVEEETLLRNEAIAEQVKIFRSKLPVLLNQLSKIEDPRNPKKQSTSWQL